MPESELNMLKIYPNPTTGIIYLDATNITNVSVYTIEGRLINSYSNEKQIDLSNLAKGVYLLSIEQNSIKTIEKIVITKKWKEYHL